MLKDKRIKVIQAKYRKIGRNREIGERDRQTKNDNKREKQQEKEKKEKRIDG